MIGLSNEATHRELQNAKGESERNMIMEMLEKVEKLREKANVSYEDAKAALEACNYDVLDALVYLEQNGKIEKNASATYTTSPEGATSQEFEQAQKSYENSCSGTSAGEVFKKFFNWLGKLLRKGCDTSFLVTRGDKEIMSVPVLVLILAALLAFWLVVILLIVGLFNNFKYYFIGIEPTTVDVNGFCQKAAETCEEIKNDFQN